MLTHKGTAYITTDWLILRPYTANDYEDVYQTWGADPEVAYYMTFTPFKSKEQTKEVLERWSGLYCRENFYLWAIELNGRVIGNINIVQISDSLESCEIGYCLGKEYYNQGIMTEAAKAVVSFLFNEVGVNRIEIEHVTENPASGRIAQKCGFRYEGTKRQAFKTPDGRFLDLDVYSVLKQEYLQQYHSDPYKNAE